MDGASDAEKWLRVESGTETWLVDAEFLRSNWSCIWDRGCAGIEASPAPDKQLGCCSVGAQMLDAEEAMQVAALGASLEPSVAQFHDVISERGALDESKTNTRVVDGACIFLNRPGFEGGAGCALHIEAARIGESAVDWKPSVCWQLPLKIERPEGSGDTNSDRISILRRWSRDDWGSDGESMAFCCTEPGSAYQGDQRVVDSLAEELVALLGVECTDELRRALDTEEF